MNLERDSFLIIDDDEHFRGFVVGQLRARGCECRAAASYEEAIQIARTWAPKYALLDHIGVAANIAAVSDQIRTAAPEIKLIGNSGSDRRAEFADAGVADYLQKPWPLDDLFHLISGRIQVCVDCGLELPLKRPQSGQQGQTWVCAGCGSRYLAILDPQATQDLRLNVRGE